MKWSAASNRNKKLKSLIVFLFILEAFFIFSSNLSLAQTDKSSPLNLEEDLEIFNEGTVNENTKATQNKSNEDTKAFESDSIEIAEEDELAGVEDEALSKDEEVENNNQVEDLIDSEMSSDILTDNEVQEEANEESTEDIEQIASDNESEEEVAAEANENIEESAETTQENIVSDSDEDTIADDTQEDTEVIESITDDTDEGEEEIVQTDEEENTETFEDITGNDDESEEETAEADEIESIEQDEFIDIEDEILSEDEQPESSPQAESLIGSEINTENDNVLSQTLVQAEEVGLSASFIKLPFEETKEERLARLQQDEYFDELIHISQTGVHQYKVTTSRIIGSVGLNIGYFPAPSINIENLTYEDIYGNNSNIAFFLNYEWKFLKKVGSLSLVPEIGLSWARGTGRFASGSINEGETPKEKYFLFVIPVGAGLMYRLQYWKNQIFTPFAIGGASYFVLLETRDDFKFSDPKESLAVAATPALYFGGGIQLSLDSFSRRAINTLDREFGINHIYFVAEVRQYFGLSNNLNFTGLVFSGGIRVDF